MSIFFFIQNWEILTAVFLVGLMVGALLGWRSILIGLTLGGALFFFRKPDAPKKEKPTPPRWIDKVRGRT